MIPTYDKIHLRFKLNNYNYRHEEIKDLACSFIKEGRDYERIIGQFLLDWLDEKSYIIVKSSGSTGRQKSIKLPKQALVNSAIATGDIFNILPGNTALHCLPANYIAGKMMLVRALVLGLEIDLIPPVASPNYDRNKNYHFCAMLPMQLQNCWTQIHNIDTLIIGGAPLSQSLIKNIQSLSTSIYATYGMTETSSHIAVKKINGQNRHDFFKVLPNIKISQDHRECLVIEAPMLSKNKLTTNDVVKIHSNSQFQLLGRYDNVINSGGVKLFPEQIESKLQPYIKSRFFIASEPNDTLGEQLILIVEGTPITINSETFEGLEKLEHPKQIYYIDRFSETPTRKINRQKTLNKLLK